MVWLRRMTFVEVLFSWTGDDHERTCWLPLHLWDKDSTWTSFVLLMMMMMMMMMMWSSSLMCLSSDVTSRLTSCKHQMIVFLSCSATMSKWLMTMTKKRKWLEPRSEPEFLALMSLCIWARDAYDIMTFDDDDIMILSDLCCTPPLTWAKTPMRHLSLTKISQQKIVDQFWLNLGPSFD